MLLPALQLLRDGVDVAEAALERVFFEDCGRAGGVIGRVDDTQLLVDCKGRREPDYHPLLEGEPARALDLGSDLLQRLVQKRTGRAQPRLRLRYL